MAGLESYWMCDIESHVYFVLSKFTASLQDQLLIILLMNHTGDLCPSLSELVLHTDLETTTGFLRPRRMVVVGILVWHCNPSLLSHVSLLFKGKWAKGFLYVAVRNVEIGDSHPGPNVNNGPSRGIVTSALRFSATRTLCDLKRNGSVLSKGPAVIWKNRDQGRNAHSGQRLKGYTLCSRYCPYQKRQTLATLRWTHLWPHVKDQSTETKRF